MEDILIKNENLNEDLANQCNDLIVSLTDIKMEILENGNSGDQEAKKDLLDTKGVVGNLPKIDASEEKEITENELKNFKEDTAFSTCFDKKIPLTGEKKIYNDVKPLTKCYDLAIARNKKRFNYMKKTKIDDEDLKMIEEEANMPESDKKKKAIIDQYENISTSCNITELCLKILEELNNDHIDEKKITRYFLRLLYSNLSPNCLLYLPHLVHSISFIRGNKKYSKKLRLAADECYQKFHAMLPIPPDSNFETTYPSEMIKFLPEDFEKFENNPLDYGDINDIL